MEAAYAFFTEAMTLLDTLPDTLDYRQQRLALVVHQAEVFVLLLKLQEYYDLLTRYESMVVALEDRGLLGTFYARLGWLQGIFGFFAQGIQVMTKAAALCEAAGNAEDAGLTYSMMQWCHVCTGDFDQALALQAHLLRAMEQRLHIRWYASAHMTQALPQVPCCVSCGIIQHPLPEEIQLHPAIPTALDQLQAIDVAFDRPVRPGERQGRFDGGIVPLEHGHEVLELHA